MFVLRTHPRQQFNRRIDERRLWRRGAVAIASVDGTDGMSVDLAFQQPNSDLADALPDRSAFLSG